MDRGHSARVTRTALILGITALAFALTGCAGVSSPAPTASPTIAPTPSPGPTATPAPPPTPRPAPTPTPTALAGPTIVAGPCVFSVDLADTIEKSVRGLSGRPQISPDFGMLWLFAREGETGIWMKGMLVPIDIVWMDREHRVLRVDANAPPQPGAPDKDLTIYSPPPGAWSVLEVAAGRASACGMAPGTPTRFVGLPPNPPSR